MPNHITNYITITHENTEEIKRLYSYFKEGCLDFNKIIEMPEELRKTVCPTTIVDTEEEANIINAEYKKEMPNNDNNIKAISKEEEKRRIDKYGYVNWYAWANNNWGTKWNCYHGQIIYEDNEKIVCQFDTAWAPPEEIFNLLIEQGFEIDGYWKDEGDDQFNMIGSGGDWSFNCEYTG